MAVEFDPTEVTKAVASAFSTSGGWMNLGGAKYWGLFHRGVNGIDITLRIQDYASEEILATYTVEITATKKEE